MKKRFLAFALLVSIVFSFVGCVGIWKYESGAKEFDSGKVEKIEFYYLTDDLALKYAVPSAENSRDRLDEMYTPTYTVAKEKHGEVIYELNRLGFKNVKVTPMKISFPKQNTYSGNVLKITYTDGTYDVISQKAQIYYTNDGAEEYENFCNLLIWTAFISSFTDSE